MDRYRYRPGLGMVLLLSLEACLAAPPDSEESVDKTNDALTQSGVSAVLTARPQT